MMAALHTENIIEIDAPLDLVYGVASAVTEWPRILSHYRYVRLLEDRSEEVPPARVVKMAAARSGIPVSWTSLQHLSRPDFAVYYHHLAGVTRGMRVAWRLRPTGSGTSVTIIHDLTTLRWWLRWPLARYVVGTVFIENIADRTLRGVKAEAERLSKARNSL